MIMNQSRALGVYYIISTSWRRALAYVVLHLYTGIWRLEAHMEGCGLGSTDFLGLMFS